MRSLAVRRLFVAMGLIAGTLGASLERAVAQTAPFSNALTGDWGGIRSALLSQGVSFEALYTGEAVGNISGGIRTKATYLDDLDLKLSLDGQRLIGWPGARLFVYGLSTHGGNPDQFIGDVQGVSNIAAPTGWRLFEAWIEQNASEDRLSVLFGQYDLSSEFYTLQSSNLFLNQSFGTGPEFSHTGQGGPSIFPETAVGGRVEVRPIPAVVVRAAVLDGVPVNVPRADGSTGIFKPGDGLLLVGEVGYLSLSDDGAGELPGQRRTRRLRAGRAAVDVPLDGKIAIGGWYYTGVFDDLSRTDHNGNPVRHRGSGGAYVIGERVVYRDSENPARRLKLFAELGLGDPSVNRFASYTGGGVTFSGLIPGRDNDETGLGVAAAHNGSQYIKSQRQQGQRAETSEVTLELTYLAQLTRWLAAQQSVQYVINPNTDPSRRDALVASFRLEISF
jgi:porin